MNATWIQTQQYDNMNTTLLIQQHLPNRGNATMIQFITTCMHHVFTLHTTLSIQRHEYNTDYTTWLRQQPYTYIYAPTFTTANIQQRGYTKHNRNNMSTTALNTHLNHQHENSNVNTTTRVTLHQQYYKATEVQQH